MEKKRKLLWIGDAVVSSGFARATHHTLDVLKESWDVSVLGLNYMGDPHQYPYDIYPAWSGGDAFGVKRTAALVSKIRPDLVVVQNDPWNVPEYMKRAGDCPTVATMPVDGKNCRGAALNGLLLGIFWTQFGLDEARKGGYAGEAAVVPLGVDLELYKPSVTKKEAREKIGLPNAVKDGFLVGNVNRNQPRKRLDLTVQYFAEWVHSFGIKDAYLFLHVAPTGDQGYDVKQLMKYYGLPGRLILSDPEIGMGSPEASLPYLYQSFDAQISTTQGEGWGLTTMEGMACGVPQIVPEWAALGEWCEDGVIKIPCRDQIVTPNNINVVGGVPSKTHFMNALANVYNNEGVRKDLIARGLAVVRKPQYRWKAVGEAFAKALDEVRYVSRNDEVEEVEVKV